MSRRSEKPAPPGGSARGSLRLVGHKGTPSELDRVTHPAQWQRPHVPTIAIASGKGGVGKSNLAANLAVSLGERGARVLLVDADFAQANLDLLLGAHPRWDLQHVLNGERQPEDIVLPTAKNVKLVPASSGVPDLAELDDYRREFLLRALSQLEADIDLVLLDLASGVSTTVTALCHAADEVIVVTTPEMPAFSDAYALIKLLHQKGRQRPPHLVVSMSSPEDEADETAHRIRLIARRFLQQDIDYLGSIPFDPAVGRAVRRQEPVVTAFPQSPAAAAYRELAGRLWEAPEPDPSVHSNPNTPQRLEA